jgi:hypothetical protein
MNPQLIPFFVAKLALLSCTCFALSADAKRSQGCRPAKVDPVNRPIVLSELPHIRGLSLHSIGVWKFGASGVSPVEFQIDEKNSRDEFVLPKGKPFTKHTGNGRIDPQDELVIRSQDLSPVQSSSKFLLAWQQSKRGGKVWQLSVCIPGQGISGLLFVSSGAVSSKIASTEKKAGVSFDLTANTISTPVYKYEFNKHRPLLLGKVSLRLQKSYEPIIASSEMRIPIRSSWYLPNTTLSADSFDSEIESWKQGPIRTIVAVGVKYERFFSLVKMHMFSEWIFYDSYFQVPQTVVLPLDFKKYLRPGSGIAYSMRLLEPDLWQWSSNIPRAKHLSPRKMVASAKNTRLPQKFYAKAVHLKKGWVINAQLRLKPGRVEGNPPPFLLVGDDFGSKALKKHWPWIRKIPGDFGVFQDFSQIEKGSYDFGLDLSLGNDAKKNLADLRTAQTTWKALF